MEATNIPKGVALDPQHRLTANDTFRFSCGPDVRCFTECCGKLELVLTPYDVLRLRKRLGMSSTDFLDRYADVRWRKPTNLPEFLFKMDADHDDRCSFVSRQGCTVYEDRPGACRIYPLGRASTKHPMTGENREFFFTVREDHCRGFEQCKDWIIKDWLDDQGMADYNRFNDLLMGLYLRANRSSGIELTERHIKMFIMALYNLERFREFVFKSGFLRKFDLPADYVQSLEGSDEVLLELAFRWLRFALFREPVMSLTAEALD